MGVGGATVTLKGDFHMHTSHSGDCDASPRDMVRGCRDVGLTCIAVTDHNTIRGALEVRELADFTVIIGEEVKSSQGDIIGLFLEEEIPRGLSPAETVSRIKGQGGLVVVPHPGGRRQEGSPGARGPPTGPAPGGFHGSPQRPNYLQGRPFQVQEPGPGGRCDAPWPSATPTPRESWAPRIWS